LAGIFASFREYRKAKDTRFSRDYPASLPNFPSHSGHLSDDRPKSGRFPVGTGGRLRSEWWPLSVGIPGRNPSEYAIEAQSPLNHSLYREQGECRFGLPNGVFCAFTTGTLAFIIRVYYPLTQEGEGKMNENSSNVLARWAKWYLLFALIISGLLIINVLGMIAFGEKLSIWPKVILLLLVWGVFISQLIGLRVIPSILAAILSMICAPAGVLMLLTTGPVKIIGLIPLAFAVFLYFYSTLTWALHEHYWLSESQRKAETT
jgi:hypothetical protein